ncbi:hypothetical protein RRG08_024175 [Elysia crispata]|uniref:Uncharacterized protein n=1 Tax=Elysia crispata TaxID=231223 RepID=A0AAE1D2P2_9GAST|nr:hypothetical protein RRG08_024175 [Elysia crispata]
MGEQCPTPVKLLKIKIEKEILKIAELCPTTVSGWRSVLKTQVIYCLIFRALCTLRLYVLNLRKPNHRYQPEEEQSIGRWTVAMEVLCRFLDDIYLTMRENILCFDPTESCNRLLNRLQKTKRSRVTFYEQQCVVISAIAIAKPLCLKQSRGNIFYPKSMLWRVGKQRGRENLRPASHRASPDMSQA